MYLLHKIPNTHLSVRAHFASVFPTKNERKNKSLIEGEGREGEEGSVSRTSGRRNVCLPTETKKLIV